MYIISNKDMEQVIEYLRLMTDTLTGKGLRVNTKKWLASNLIKKLEAKQPFPTSALPNDLKRTLRRK